MAARPMEAVKIEPGEAPQWPQQQAFDASAAVKREKVEVLREPKRPHNAYFIFFHGRREEIEREAGTRAGHLISKFASQLWKDLPDDEREPFEKQAAERLEAYRKAIAEFKAAGGVSERPRKKKKMSAFKGNASPLRVPPRLETDSGGRIGNVRIGRRPFLATGKFPPRHYGRAPSVQAAAGRALPGQALLGRAPLGRFSQHQIAPGRVKLERPTDAFPQHQMTPGRIKLERPPSGRMLVGRAPMGRAPAQRVVKHERDQLAQQEFVQAPRKEPKRKRHPDEPKMPVGGAYGFFLKEHRDEFTKEVPAGATPTAMMRLAAWRWKSVSASELERYQSLYEAARAKYEGDLKEFRIQHPDVVPISVRRARPAAPLPRDMRSVKREALPQYQEPLPRQAPPHTRAVKREMLPQQAPPHMRHGMIQGNVWQGNAGKVPPKLHAVRVKRECLPDSPMEEEYFDEGEEEEQLLMEEEFEEEEYEELEEEECEDVAVEEEFRDGLPDDDFEDDA